MWKRFVAIISLLWLLSSPLVFCEEATQETCSTPLPTLVVGATGNTGKHVVQQLLNQGRPVHVIVRSADRMRGLLDSSSSNSNKQRENLLKITEASLLDLTVDELQAIVDESYDVVSCLGHNMSFKGLFGQPRRLVTVASQRLTQAMLQASSSSSSSSANTKGAHCQTQQQQGHPRKFILMSSDGVACVGDDERQLSERIVLALLRKLIPPHADNEAAAEYVQSSSLATDSAIEWTIVRPTDLIDGSNDDGTTTTTTTGEYTVFDKPLGSLFGSGSVTRANVAKFMVDLIVDNSLWKQYRFRFPVVYDKDAHPVKSEL